MAANTATRAARMIMRVTRADFSRSVSKATTAGDLVCFFIGLELGDNDAAIKLNHLCAILQPFKCFSFHSVVVLF